MLDKNPKRRPSINQLLTHPLVKDKIPNCLNKEDFENEFSHTVLHNYDALEDYKQKKREAKKQGLTLENNMRENYTPGVD